MALFLPPNVTPLAPAETLKSWEDGSYADAEFFQTPTGLSDRKVEIDYVNLSDELRITDQAKYLQTILDHTPKPKGRPAFSSLHVVGPSEKLNSFEAELTIDALLKGAEKLKKEVHVHRLPENVCCPSSSSTTISCSAGNPRNAFTLSPASTSSTTPMEEYNAIFETASSLLIQKADRASLLIFVGWNDVDMDAYAALIGMLPFRGLQVACLSRRTSRHCSTEDMLRFRSKTGTFDMDGRNSARMGKFTVHAVFGPYCESRHFSEPVQPWCPVNIDKGSIEATQNVVRIPFKIGGLELPMMTHNGLYEEALQAFSELLQAKYPKGYTPIVSVGETCDALGYGQDMLDALGQEGGFLFSHKSGETYKRYDNYGSDRLFAKMNEAKASTAPPVIIALGGGVNGNCIGLIAALTNCDFIEVPTTPMHYNDAVTSAKKAFSLVVDDKILSKNILGAFYLPQLAYCINETLLTISSANAHATVGEATKTMNMLGIANSAVGASDFHNILGGKEFASDFTKILSEVGGFDRLVQFIENPTTLKKKREIIEIGKKIASLREAKHKDEHKDEPFFQNLFKRFNTSFQSSSSSPSLVGSSLGSTGSLDGTSSDSDSDSEESMEELMRERKMMMRKFRASFHEMPEADKLAILSFLTTINKEIVAAKAMFLAYSDPFEKYRALLFEYAHTLGHGVEAFANGLYLKAKQKGVVVPSNALRLHGQCVGMAVLWAGEMSKNLGKLEGEGYILHQSFPYLFNRSGGFSFKPLRDLCLDLQVTKEEFCEQVLEVVRRDNKRGYCNCGPNKSVDQLVTCRPGKMLQSKDPNAEVRYLVEVDEEWQRNVLAKAFDGEFDKVADLKNGMLTFVQTGAGMPQLNASSAEVAGHIRKSLSEIYSVDDASFCAAP